MYRLYTIFLSSQIMFKSLRVNPGKIVLGTLGYSLSPSRRGAGRLARRTRALTFAHVNETRNTELNVPIYLSYPTRFVLTRRGRPISTRSVFGARYHLLSSRGTQLRLSSRSNCHFQTCRALSGRTSLFAADGTSLSPLSSLLSLSLTLRAVPMRK